MNLASLYLAIDRVAVAEPMLLEALDILEKRGYLEPTVFTIRQYLATIHFQQGRLRDAEQLERKCLTDQEAVYGFDNPQLAHSIHNLAVYLHRHGQFSEAEGLFHRVIALLEKARRAEHLEYAVCLASYSHLLRDTKGEKEALRFLKRAKASVGDRLKDSGMGLTVDARALRNWK